MGWENIDQKYKTRYGKEYVWAEATYERMFVKKIIKQEFPTLSDEKIDEAVRRCCETIPTPRARQIFWKGLQERLGVG